MDYTWKTVALIVGAGLGVAKFLWDVGKVAVGNLSTYMSEENKVDLEREKIRAEQERVIYDDLRDRLRRMEDRMQEMNSDIDNWKKNYYEIKIQHQDLLVQNKLLTRANRQLRQTVEVLRNYLSQLVDRLSDYEDIDPLPDFPDQPLNITAINESVLENLDNPDVDTPVGDVFEGVDVDTLEQQDLPNNE